MRRAEEGPARARAYLRLAVEYLAAAEALEAAGLASGPNQRPFWMAMASSLELVLKAVLSHHGESEERLMLIGHDLRGCLRRASERGGRLSTDLPLQDLVFALHSPHAMGMFRYPAVGRWPALPEPIVALDVLSRVLVATIEDLAALSARSPQPGTTSRRPGE